MAVEMATPGRTGLMRSSITARVPANPANTATRRSKRVGSVRASISEVTSVVKGSDPNRAPKNMARITPPNSARTARPKSWVSPRTMPRDMPNMGVMSGETSMAPMTTATLFKTRPRLAIKEAAEMSA